MIREGDTVIVRMHDDESSHMLMVKDSQKLFKKKVNVERKKKKGKKERGRESNSKNK